MSTDALVAELADLRRQLEAERPDLAERLDRVVEQMAAAPRGYVSTGEAAEVLGVSRNTVKKWIRQGFIRDVWSLPDSGYLKISRVELERVKAELHPPPAGR